MPNFPKVLSSCVIITITVVSVSVIVVSLYQYIRADLKKVQRAVVPFGSCLYEFFSLVFLLKFVSWLGELFAIHVFRRRLL